MMSHDDPRFTAYALGELSGAEQANDRAAVEAALATDPAAKALVEEIRAEADLLAEALRTEPATGLTLEQRGEILDAASAAAGRRAAEGSRAAEGFGAPEGRPVAGASWRRWAPFALVGSAAAAMVVVALGSSETRPEERVGFTALARPVDGSMVSQFEESRLEVKNSKPAPLGWPAMPGSSTVHVDSSAEHSSSRTASSADPSSPVAPSSAPMPRDSGSAGESAGKQEKEATAARLEHPRDSSWRQSKPQGNPVGSGASGSAPPSSSGRPTEPKGPGVPPGLRSPADQPVAPGVPFAPPSTPGTDPFAPPPTTTPPDPSFAPVPAPLPGPVPLAPVDALALKARTVAARPGALPGAPVGTPLAPAGWAGSLDHDKDGTYEDARRKAKAESSPGESYDAVTESPFQPVATAPLSTFSIDVDTASYANVRRMINSGQRPPADAVRIEELLNYFPYADPAPAGDEPFAVRTEVAACPWNLKHRLVRIGVHGREIERKARPASNLVFLIDVSGSMDQPEKLPLVQASMRMLLEELNERDTVSIVVYAGATGLVLPPTSCEQKAVIQRAIDQMKAGGSTNGAAGLELAYQTAQQSFLRGGVNRVVLATDGDWNVGVTSRGGLLELIQEKAKSGIFLTVLGYGMGNLKDGMLETLADKGNGNYGYIDSTREARKVLVEGASGTLVTIAKDVKIQVEFNPARVASYRLVGYDNRLLAARDFNDDTKDAGEIGAGHTVTALYEIVPVGVEDAPPPPPPAPEVDPLKYQGAPQPPATPAPPAAAPPPVVPAALAGETMTVKLRWKQPDGQTSVKREFPVTDTGAPYEKASSDFKFASSVAQFALILKRSPYAGTASLEGVLELASEGLSFDPSGYRKEFLDLVARAIAVHLGR